MVHFLQLKFQIAFLILRKSHWLVSCGVKKKSEKISREKEKLFIHFVFRHNTLSTQIHSKYERNISDSEPLDGENWGHFPHHPRLLHSDKWIQELKVLLALQNCRHITIQFNSRVFLPSLFCDPLFLRVDTTKGYSIVLV